MICRTVHVVQPLIYPTDPMTHLPVLYHEILEALNPKNGGYYVDGTVGAGGHAWGILDASSPNSKLVGLDLDPQALDLASQKLSTFGDRVTLMQASYITLGEAMNKLGWSSVQGIVLDLGVSSMQFDTPERGFSLKVDAPLDMRFSPLASLTAADLVNSLPEAELADLIYRYGEERRSRQVARALVQARPIYTTLELARIVSRVVGKGKKYTRLHPATRTFQALRIATNQELEAVETVLPLAVSALAPGGRLAVISFHSLEDRLVKQYFHQESRDCICPPEIPICNCGHRAGIKIITRKPIQASVKEIDQNPRARSARLRVAEKL